MLWAQKQKGFTIVELLIVVVVIAILAAITIVAYNGVQNRAKESAAQSAASQAAKKVSTYAVLNSDMYPAASSLATDVGIVPSFNNSTPYQYTLGPDIKSFCLTATTNNISYYVSNQNLKPTKGACEGHGLNGATPTTITNMITNPSLETNASGWALHSSLDPGGRVQSNGRWVFTGTRSLTGATAIYISQAVPVTVTPNATYTGSVLITSSVNQSINLQIRIGGTTTAIASETISLEAGVPKRAWVTGNVGSNTNVFLTILSSSGSVGDVLTADEAMFVEGSKAYPYFDGSSPSWAWSGTAHQSTSTGPAY